MTAAGRINASQVTEGTRVIVKINHNDAGLFTSWDISRNKTGEGVMVARVTAKEKCSNRRGYMLYTSVSETPIYCEPIQTMWLAPEDAAGIKRAHAEALAEFAQWEMDEATANQATPQYRYFAEVSRLAGGYAAAMGVLETEARVMMEAEAEITDAAVELDQEPLDELQERDMIRIAGPVSPQGYLDALAAKGQADAIQAGVAAAEAQAARENTPEVAKLREEHKTAGPFKKARIEARLAYLGAVLYPQGTPEYATYAKALKEALAAPGAWDFLNI